MKLTIEARALAACRALYATRSEVERLSHEIGAAISACHTVWFHEQEKKGDPWTVSWPEYVSHLKAAYEPIINEHEYGDETRYLSDGEIVAMLAECPHCLAAHRTIQERKAARRKLGAARRAVTMVGRTKPMEAA